MRQLEQAHADQHGRFLGSLFHNKAFNEGCDETSTDSWECSPRTSLTSWVATSSAGLGSRNSGSGTKVIVVCKDVIVAPKYIEYGIYGDLMIMCRKPYSIYLRGAIGLVLFDLA